MMSWSLGALFGTEELLCTSPGCRLFLPIKMLLRTQPTANGFIKKAGRSTQGTFLADRLSLAGLPAKRALFLQRPTHGHHPRGPSFHRGT